MNVGAGQDRSNAAVWVAAVAVAALGFHALAFLTYPPSDLYGFVRPWYRELMAHGLSRPVGNYSPPYLYFLWAMTLLEGLTFQILLIKLLAVFGALWMAFAASRVLGSLGVARWPAILTLALPSTILNVSLLGQADVFWITPSLLAIAAAIEGKHAQTAIWAGLAFAVKAQAAIIAPFVIYLFVSNRVPFRVWLLAPAALVLAWLPAWLAGWPLSYLATVYLGQVEWMNNDHTFFIGGGASIWTPLGYLFPQQTYDARWFGLPIVVAGTAVYGWLLPKPSSKKTIILAALIGAAWVPFLAPLVRERFFMLADVLAFLYALAYPTRRNIVMASLVQIASAMPVLVFAFAWQPWDAAAAPFLVIGLGLALDVRFRPRSRVPEGARRRARLGAR